MESERNHFHADLSTSPTFDWRATLLAAQDEHWMVDELSAMVGAGSIQHHILDGNPIPEDSMMQLNNAVFYDQQYTGVMNLAGHNDLSRVVTGGAITTDSNHINNGEIVPPSTIEECTPIPLIGSSHALAQEAKPRKKPGRKPGSGKGVQKKKELSQSLCDLRAVVPNSSMMDEASLIATAASNIKDLMSKVQDLEMQVSAAAVAGRVRSGCWCRVIGISVEVVEHPRKVLIHIDCGNCSHWTVRITRLGAALREMGIQVKSADTQWVEEQLYVQGTAVMERTIYTREQIRAALQEKV